MASCLALVSSVAVAGQAQPAAVEVDLVNMSAHGDMRTARNDKDKDVFIGCGVRTLVGGAEPFYFGFCQAEDAEGERIVCSTLDPDLLFAMNATADNSFVTFSWNEVDECTRIGFSTQSFYLPKTGK
jgi:hypothetical protein